MSYVFTAATVVSHTFAGSRLSLSSYCEDTRLYKQRNDVVSITFDTRGDDKIDDRLVKNYSRSPSNTSIMSPTSFSGLDSQPPMVPFSKQLQEQLT